MWSQARQGGGLAAIERSEFGQFGQDAQGGDRADAINGLQTLGLPVEGLILLAEFFQLAFDLSLVAFQAAHQTLGLTAQEGVD